MSESEKRSIFFQKSGGEKKRKKEKTPYGSPGRAELQPDFDHVDRLDDGRRGHPGEPAVDEGLRGGPGSRGRGLVARHFFLVRKKVEVERGVFLFFSTTIEWFQREREAFDALCERF